MNVAAIDEKSTKAVTGSLASYLSDHEVTKYNSLDDQKRSDWLSGRLALKAAALNFSLSFNSLADIDIDNSPNGQPYIVGEDKVFCSIAHSHSWAIGAVSTDRIGVDIERIRPHAEDLLKYLADDDEIAILKTGFKSPSDLITAIWTIKEAVLKGLGIGFGITPKELKIGRSGNGGLVPVEVKTTGFISRWQVSSCRENDFFIAVASPKNYEQKQIDWYYASRV